MQQVHQLYPGYNNCMHRPNICSKMKTNVIVAWSSLKPPSRSNKLLLLVVKDAAEVVAAVFVVITVDVVNVVVRDGDELSSPHTTNIYI